MHEHALRTILFIQAVEDSDTKGELLPLAEREEATQAVAAGEGAVHEAFADGVLTAGGERLLTRRALHLYERLRLRAPIIEHVLAVAAGSGAADGLRSIALLVGLLLAVLDGRGYIDILGWSILLLLAWNLLVYVLLAANWLRPRRWSGTGVASLYARWMVSRAGSVLKRSRSFNVPLAAALPRFSADWGALSRDLVMLRARRIFHVCAALVAVGFIAGIFIRGLVLRDVAGWQSSFLGGGIVRACLKLLYGPAAAILEMALPAAVRDAAALRVTDAGGGAAPLAWLELMTLTFVLFIIAPRLLGAVLASVRLWVIARRMAIPAAVVPYARRVLPAARADLAGSPL
jgi:hypothetical protein